VQAEPLSTLLCRVCEESTDTASVTFAMEGEERPIPGLVTAQAIRLVREAIANALKHAEPDTVQVTMRMDAERLHLQVKDDGKGFDPAKAPGADRGHFGLSGMAERIERLGGTMQITSAPGAGATFDFSIPLPKS
jgi:two-component system, NarL family, sensor histidine kinase DegS